MATKKILFVLGISFLLIGSIVFAADPDDMDQYAIQTTQRRPIPGLGTVFYNEDPYNANFFINTHGIRDYPIIYPAERQQAKFFGTTGYPERSELGLELFYDEKASMTAYYNQRRQDRVQQLNEFYGTPFILRTQEIIPEKSSYIPKYPIKAANYPYRGEGFSWPVINNNVIDDMSINAIRTHARARTETNRALVSAYFAGLRPRYDPLRVAMDVPFSYSDNYRLRERQLPKTTVHWNIPFFIPDPEDPLTEEYDPYYYK